MLSATGSAKSTCCSVPALYSSGLPVPVLSNGVSAFSAPASPRLSPGCDVTGWKESTPLLNISGAGDEE